MDKTTKSNKYNVFGWQPGSVLWRYIVDADNEQDALARAQAWDDGEEHFDDLNVSMLRHPIDYLFDDSVDWHHAEVGQVHQSLDRLDESDNEAESQDSRKELLYDLDPVQEGKTRFAVDVWQPADMQWHYRIKADNPQHALDQMAGDGGETRYWQSPHPVDYMAQEGNEWHDATVSALPDNLELFYPGKGIVASKEGKNMSDEKSIKISAPTIWEDTYLQDHTKKELNALLKSYEEAEWQCPRCNERNPVWSSSTVIKGWNDFGTEYIVNKECGGEIDPCPKCEGSARQDGVDCPKCSGTGTYRNKRCEECQGQGEPFCNKCNGQGRQWCGFKRKNRDEYLVTPKGKRSSVKTALENPFDGYGRPFSEDPLNPNVDPAYFGDNPASDTKPYAGPNSYSINTTGPYSPPNSGMEDPGQNVGPYSPPGYADMQGIYGDQSDNASTEADQLGQPTGTNSEFVSQASTFESWNNQIEWFDGTSDSIYRRIASARELQKTSDKATAHLIEQQVKVLEKVANEFADSSLAEYMTSVPGGTVAMDYDDLTDGGLVDLSSFISTEAHKYITEVNNYDWERFANDAPRMWITAKANSNPGVLRHETSTREAAVDYVASKTMVLMDPVLRADIIDNFVNDVEVERRSYLAAVELQEEENAARKVEFERQQRERVAAELNELQYPDEFFPGQTVAGTNDPFDFGIDDGSAMYQDAVNIVQANASRNWEDFCTEGARDWFYSNETGMYRHADTTRHAAKQYVDDETALVKDAALKSEIRRAFLASVDYLREEWLEKKANNEEIDEDIDVLSEYYDNETLW